MEYCNLHSETESHVGSYSTAVKVHQMYERADINSALEGQAKSIPSSMQKKPKWRVHLFPNLLLQWISTGNEIFSRKPRNKSLCF
jgi:hypothetical protein